MTMRSAASAGGIPFREHFSASETEYQSTQARRQCSDPSLRSALVRLTDVGTDFRLGEADKGGELPESQPILAAELLRHVNTLGTT